MNRGWFLFLTHGEWAITFLISIMYLVVIRFMFKSKMKKLLKNTGYVFIITAIGLLISNIVASYIANK